MGDIMLTPPSESDQEEEHDLLLDWMRLKKIVVTREKYLSLAYPDGLPAEWTAELEAQLPRSLQQPLDPP